MIKNAYVFIVLAAYEELQIIMEMSQAFVCIRMQIRLQAHGSYIGAYTNWVQGTVACISNNPEYNGYKYGLPRIQLV